MSLLTQASLVLTPNAYKANKLYSIIPSSGNGDLTTTRATTATRVNSSGLVENVATGIPRVDYTNGVANILLEPQRTNRLLNSATVVTQTITTTAVDNTLSFYGTGTITLSGTFSGSLVGTGEANRVSLTFTPTAGSLVLTVSGTCTNGQLELGSYATSYIPTTTSTVTRNADTIERTSVGSDILNPSEGTFYVEIASIANDLVQKTIEISDNTDNNRVIISAYTINNTFRLQVLGGAISKVVNVAVTDITSFNKVLIKWGTEGSFAFVNGNKYTLVGSGTLPTALNKISFAQWWNGTPFSGKCKGMQIYKIPLTDAECISLTTL